MRTVPNPMRGAGGDEPDPSPRATRVWAAIIVAVVLAVVLAQHRGDRLDRERFIEGYEDARACERGDVSRCD